MANEKKNPTANPDILMLGYLCIKDLKSVPEKVAILDRFGLLDSDIAIICDCAIQSVKDARYRAKKKGGKKNDGD